MSAINRPYNGSFFQLKDILKIVLWDARLVLAIKQVSTNLSESLERYSTKVPGTKKKKDCQVKDEPDVHASKQQSDRRCSFSMYAHDTELQFQQQQQVSAQVFSKV